MESIDFSLQTVNTEQPTIWSVAYVMLMAFALSTCIALVYHITSERKSSNGQFIQTLILGSIGAAIIVLAIGDSVGRGLGILGALAIIRFRTTLQQQRDIVFVFCALGIGMACGMFGFNIAVIGTAILCALVLLFRLTPLHGLSSIKQRLRINIPLDSSVNLNEIENVFRKMGLKTKLERSEYVKDDKKNSKQFTFELPEEIDTLSLLAELERLDPQVAIRLWSRNENDID